MVYNGRITTTQPKEQQMGVTQSEVMAAMDFFNQVIEPRYKVKIGAMLVAMTKDFVTDKAPSKHQEFTLSEIEVLKDGRKLEAVKMVKNRLELSLMEAKKYVEHYGDHMLHQSGYYERLHQ